MDPVDYSRLLIELRAAATPEIITVDADKLTPGCVLAGKEWDRHVVVALPHLLSPKRQNIAIRKMYGGQRITLRQNRSARVTIYRAKLAAGSVYLVPEVPHCFAPDIPESGDRVAFQMARPHSLGCGHFVTYGGREWTHISDAISPATGSTTLKVDTYATIRPFLAHNQDASNIGWYTYLPAGHRPHLYVDGRPMPARPASDLRLGDVLRLPGGAKLQIISGVEDLDGRHFKLQVIRRSTHELFCMMVGSNVDGAVIEHHDSGRTGALYATEPRPSELLSTADIRPGDTIISMWDRHASAVAEVDDVVRQPLSTSMHMAASAVDGRHFEIGTGLDPRHVLLHRPTPEHAYAAPELIGARAS